LEDPMQALYESDVVANGISLHYHRTGGRAGSGRL
jgi:hypothetical protein